MILAYSASLPFESFHLRYMTEASTLAGLDVLGSLNRDITESNIVLYEEKERNKKICKSWVEDVVGKP